MIIDNNILLMVLISIGLIILLLLFYIYKKDADSAKRFALFEKALEDHSVEIFNIQKGLDSLPTQDINSIKDSILDEVLDSNSVLKDNLNTLGKEINRVEESLAKEISSLDSKIKLAQNSIKEFSYTGQSTSKADEQKIISMFQDGWSLDKIAKDLKVSKGEIELILNLSKIDGK